MEFKGTAEKWRSVFTSDLKRAVRSDGGILMTFWKPNKYSGQDERYERELKETQANQLLCSKAPEMLALLINFTKAIPDNSRWDYQACMSEAYKLIKEATEL